jgi:hypothetical protein
MTSERLGEMFVGDSADMGAGKFPLVLMGGRAEGLACADPEARATIGASGIYKKQERSVYKCTEARIHSHITVPSKVCASQLLKQVKFCSEQKIDREDGFFIFQF